MINKLKVLGIGFGFFIASLLLSLVYMWITPYLIQYFFSIILLTDQDTLKYLLPPPYIIMITGWIYIIGVYFNKLKMVRTSETIFALSVIIGVLITFMRWIYA